MLIFDAAKIGAKMLHYRKLRGLTQSQLAELAGIADRTYADIERGTVDMRVSTLLSLCSALNVTSDSILSDSESESSDIELCKKLLQCNEKHRSGAEKILSAYLDAIE